MFEYIQHLTLVPFTHDKLTNRFNNQIVVQPSRSIQLKAEGGTEAPYPTTMGEMQTQRAMSHVVSDCFSLSLAC